MNESHERAEAGSTPLQPAQLPRTRAVDVDASQTVVAWLDAFHQGADVFAESAYWRDHLCLTWDMRCLRGPQLAAAERCQLALDPNLGPRAADLTDLFCVEAFLIITTQIGRGRGFVRLIPCDGTWKAFTLFTTLEQLHGVDEPIGKHRPQGVAHGTFRGRRNWQDGRTEEKNFVDTEPVVVILGAGQAGLMTAARLKMLGIPALVVDRNARIGDNWRRRYHQLVLHDPVWMNHLPYLPFPQHWPIFTPKDKLGDWFETYASALELNVWTESTITSSSWDEASRQWTVTIETRSGTRTVHPKHVIQATGHSGEPNMPAIKGRENFRGSLCHSSEYVGASFAASPSKVVVVGCCNSGHDIAQDLFEHGHDVTLVQRSSTFVISAEANVQAIAPLFAEGGMGVEDADIVFQSFPNQVLMSLNVAATAQAAETDKNTLAALAQAGFKLDKGPGDAGIWIKYLQRGGGYYIDVGCSALIGQGKIKIKQGVEMEEILPHGVKFADGTVLDADQIIFATGYQNMRTQCRRFFGDVADRVSNVWGFDDEGELRMWRPTGHPGFWFVGGNFALCRYFSRLVALQIKRLEEGL